MTLMSKKLKYKRIENLTNIKKEDDIDLLIKRSVGYFNSILKNNEEINKGHIINYFFILEDILKEQDKHTPTIIYKTQNKILKEYGEYILIMRFKNQLSLNDIVKTMKSKYKKSISRAVIYNFINFNKSVWGEYYE